MEQKPQLTYEDMENAVKRGRMIWYVMLCLPILYLLLCILVRELWFEEGRRGFLPTAGTTARNVIFVVMTVIAAGMQLLLIGLGKFYNARIKAAASLDQFVDLFWKRLFFQGVVCDSVSFLGLLYYILFGDLRVMFIFGAISYVLYAQIQPKEKLDHEQ